MMHADKSVAHPVFAFSIVSVMLCDKCFTGLKHLVIYFLSEMMNGSFQDVSFRWTRHLNSESNYFIRWIVYGI